MAIKMQQSQDLADIVSKVYVALIPDLFRFPCIAHQPKMVREDYMRWYVGFPPKFQSLLVSLHGKSYSKIALDIYNGLMPEPTAHFTDIPIKDQELLYKIIIPNRNYQEMFCYDRMP